jgi:hypothetical protein
LDKNPIWHSSQKHPSFQYLLITSPDALASFVAEQTPEFHQLISADNYDIRNNHMIAFMVKTVSTAIKYSMP